MTPSKSSNRRPNGFTLIETLISLALAATGFLVLLLVHVAALNSRAIATSQAHLLEARRVVEGTVRERLEEANGVATPASGTSSVLTLTDPDPLETPTVFSVVGGRLVLQVGASAPVFLTPPDVTVSAFSAERLDGLPVSVALSYTLETDATPKVHIERTFTVTYALNF
jgi:prepilin-type N-terminal cleavage/methylation domain-containing protein